MKYQCQECRNFFEDKEMYAFATESGYAYSYKVLCKECAKDKLKVEDCS